MSSSCSTDQPGARGVTEHHQLGDSITCFLTYSAYPSALQGKRKKIEKERRGAGRKMREKNYERGGRGKGEVGEKVPSPDTTITALGQTNGTAISETRLNE